MTVEVFIQTENILGEGPVWDHSRNELLWVDIEQKQIHFYHPRSGKKETFSFDYPIGAAVPVARSEQYLLALQNGLALFSRNNQSLKYISNCESEIESNRFNDGKCDPLGRFWIGSMNMQVSPQKGSLYCIDGSLSVSKKLSELTISNGMAWSNDGKMMYFTDTATRCVTQFDFNAEAGTILNAKTAITIPEELGWPDGMCVDSEGMLWIANWGAACITRWNPETGVLIQKIEIPAIHISSLCFGGDNLESLFITSARTGLSQAELSEYPLSGSVFILQPNVSGVQSNFFRIDN